MARGDIYPLDPVSTGQVVSRDVKSGTTASIKAGEMVLLDGANAGYVKIAVTTVASAGAVIAGVSLTDSTETTTADGKVSVYLGDGDVRFRGRALVTASLAQAQKGTALGYNVTTGNHRVDQSTGSGICNMLEYNSTTGEVDFVFRQTNLAQAV